VLGSSANTSAPIPIGARLRRRRLRKTTMTKAHATQQRLLGARPKPVRIPDRIEDAPFGSCACRLTPPDRRQCDRFFYGLINLANVLTARGAALPPRRCELAQRANCPRFGGQPLGSNY
jgi:hypothetical protein